MINEDGPPFNQNKAQVISEASHVTNSVKTRAKPTKSEKERERESVFQ
jgi:hypothetical protein